MIENRSTHDPYPLNKPACDWLTMTTYDDKPIQSFIESMGLRLSRQMEEDGRFLGYDGKRGKHCFYGSGTVVKRFGADDIPLSHHIIRISGYLAQRYLEDCRDTLVNELKCTRVDFQITNLRPQGFTVEQLYDILQGVENWGRRKPTLTIWKNSKGGGTVYVGSRKSDRYTRIYLKGNGWDFDKVRVEVEIKGNKADSYMPLMSRVHPSKIAAQALIDFMTGLPVEASDHDYAGLYVDWKKTVLEHLYSFDPSDEPENAIYVRSSDKTIAWINRQVIPSFLRLVSERGEGDQKLMEIADKFASILDVANSNGQKVIRPYEKKTD